jgi:Ca2+-transporting ATPase
VVHDNLRRTVRFLFATNLSEVLLVLGATFANREAMSPLQLLWINLIGDTIPALALAFEPGELGLLQRPPLAPGSPLLSREDWRFIARGGVALASLGGLALALGGPVAAFSTLTAAQLGYTFHCRARAGRPSGNFVLMVGGAAALQLGALASPTMRRLLALPPPSLASFGGYALGLALPLLVGGPPADEIVARGKPLELSPRSHAGGLR